MPKGQGNTTASQDDRIPAPRLPHERDESAGDETSSEPSQKAVGEVALDDLTGEKTNTDRSKETDLTYNRNFPREDTKPRP